MSVYRQFADSMIKKISYSLDKASKHFNFNLKNNNLNYLTDNPEHNTVPRILCSVLHDDRCDNPEQDENKKLLDNPDTLPTLRL